jgi:pyruvate-formate lyase-activating enzyme
MTDDSAQPLAQRRAEQYRTDRDDARLLSETPPLPANMMVELSNACNHACIFCANSYMQRKIGRIDRDLLFRIMAEAHALGTREIGFYTTGDPFIHKDLAAFTRHAKELGFTYIYISTNGALATPERVKEVIDAGMDSIKFSINAGSRETYKLIHGKDDWDTVVANIDFIANYRKQHAPHVKLAVTCVVTRPVMHEIDAIKARFGPLVDDMWFPYCSVQSGQMNAAQALLGFTEQAARSESKVWTGAEAKAERGVCRLPFNRLHVSCEGYLTLCCVDYQNYLAVADLTKTSLAEAWHNPAFREMRRRHLGGQLSGSLCGNCWLGETGPVEPVDSRLADRVDFTRFYSDQQAQVMKRLNSFDAGKSSS